MGEEVSWKFCSTWCWQTDVADYHSSGEKLLLYSDSIHGSQKARKRTSGEVITQEALAARQTQTKALRCGDGGWRHANVRTIPRTGLEEGRGAL